jgi:hypothetical protein
MKTVMLTPEGLGVLRALARLGAMRRYDAVGLELAAAGLAKVSGERLLITESGYAAAAAARTGKTLLRPTSGATVLRRDQVARPNQS